MDIGLGSNIAIALACESDGKFLELGTANGEPIIGALEFRRQSGHQFGVRGQVFVDSDFNFGIPSSESSETPTGLAIQSSGQIIVTIDLSV